MTMVVAAACVIVSCTYYGDAPVYGFSSLVSRDDLREGTAAVRKINYVGKVYAYRVNSRNDIQIYISPDFDGSYWAARRVNGKWEQNGGELTVRHAAGE